MIKVETAPISRGPSEQFIAAMSIYSGGAEGSPPVSVIGATNMQDVMRAKSDRIPSQVYYFEVRHSNNNGNQPHEEVVTGIETGEAAGEFIRTSDYGLADTDRTVEVKEGQGVIVVQKNAINQRLNVISDVVEDFKAIKLRKGQKVVVPPGSFYALVNTDRTDILVVRHDGRSDNNPSSDNPNSQVLRDMNGFAFRVVAVDSHVCLQINSNYMRANILQFQSGGIPFSGDNLD